MKYEYKETKIKKKEPVLDATDLAIDIGTNILRARVKAGLTQAEMAKKMGTLQPSIARVECGAKIPSSHFLLRVAKVLKTHVIAPTFDSLVSEKKIECSSCRTKVPARVTLTDSATQQWCNSVVFIQVGAAQTYTKKIEMVDAPFALA